MKRFLKKLGVRCPDEMEEAIRSRAQRNAYVFLIFALLLWSLYESYRVYAYHSQLNLFPCLLLTAAAVIQAFSQSIMTRSAVKDDPDSHETGPLTKLVVLTCAAVSAAAAIVSALLFMGVRV